VRRLDHTLNDMRRLRRHFDTDGQIRRRLREVTQDLEGLDVLSLQPRERSLLEGLVTQLGDRISGAELDQERLARAVERLVEPARKAKPS